MLRVGVNATVIFATFIVLWFVRQAHRRGHRAHRRGRRGRVQRAVHEVTCFATDRPVHNKVFHAVGEWVVVMFLRVPGLVLMYSAANNSLVMPSYPLDPKTEFFFKMVQAVLAVLILTQTLLPALRGALRRDVDLPESLGVDGRRRRRFPILSVAVVYLTSPWESHKLTITSLSESQVRWVRLTLGFGFLVARLARRSTTTISSPASPTSTRPCETTPWSKLLAFGTDPAFRRECWVVSFGLGGGAERLHADDGHVHAHVGRASWRSSSRSSCSVDFGWNEIPHLFPIGALTAITFSNRLEGELDPIEARAERAGPQRKSLKQAAIIGATALGLALVVDLSDALRPHIHRSQQPAVGDGGPAMHFATARQSGRDRPRLGRVPRRLRPARESAAARDVLGGVQGGLDASHRALGGRRPARAAVHAAPLLQRVRRADVRGAHTVRLAWPTVAAPPSAAAPAPEVELEILDLPSADFVVVVQALQDVGLVAEKVEVFGMGHYRLEVELPSTSAPAGASEPLERLPKGVPGSLARQRHVDPVEKTVLVYARLNAVVDVVELTRGSGTRASRRARSRILTGPES